MEKPEKVKMKPDVTYARRRKDRKNTTPYAGLLASLPSDIKMYAIADFLSLDCLYPLRMYLPQRFAEVSRDLLATEQGTYQLLTAALNNKDGWAVHRIVTIINRRANRVIKPDCEYTLLSLPYLRGIELYDIDFLRALFQAKAVYLVSVFLCASRVLSEPLTKGVSSNVDLLTSDDIVNVVSGSALRLYGEGLLHPDTRIINAIKRIYQRRGTVPYDIKRAIGKRGMDDKDFIDWLGG